MIVQRINSSWSTWRHTVKGAHTHTSVKTCNQTGVTAIRHWQNINTATLSVALSNPLTLPTPTQRLWPSAQKLVILSAGAMPTKKGRK